MQQLNKEYGQVTYHIYKRKCLYGSNRYYLQSKITIKCEGGESMEKTEKLVFLSPEDVPRLTRGKQGRNWKELFDKIPKGKVLAMNTEIYGSAPNIRVQVNLYNKDAKEKVLTVTQRTENENVIVYVQRK